VRNGGAEEDLDFVNKDSDLADAIGKLIVGAGRKARNIVRFVLPTVLNRPSWASDDPLKDFEKRFFIHEVTLQLLKFLKPGESHIDGKAMLSRLWTIGGGPLAGNRAFEYLAAHLEIIPEEWKLYVLVFAGTIWPDSLFREHVQCLVYSGERWDRSDRWLGCDFDSYYRVVGFRQVV